MYDKLQPVWAMLNSEQTVKNSPIRHKQTFVYICVLCKYYNMCICCMYMLYVYTYRKAEHTTTDILPTCILVKYSNISN